MENYNLGKHKNLLINFEALSYKNKKNLGLK